MTKIKRVQNRRKKHHQNHELKKEYENIVAFSGEYYQEQARSRMRMIGK